jgi:aryl-alcohol dehydrogenase-like predicted oxidoreductase
MSDRQSNRREFLSTTVSGAVAAGVAVSANPEVATAAGGDMPMRTLGSTGEKVSLLCVGGYHIGVKSLDEAASVRLMHEAIDHGATFLDNAWEYHDGRSEERMGKAIAGRRDKVFLMTKHHGRDKKTAMQHLEDSLRRLKTDVIDLWQFHEIVYENDPERIFAPGGGIEAAELAVKQGKARYIGFTGHKSPYIHLKMLAYGYPFAAVQMPLSILDGSYESFEKWVLPVLVQRNIGVLAMKTRANGAITNEKIATVDECWRYAVSLPVSTVVSGMNSLDILRDNLRLVRDLKPMTADERAAIRERTHAVAMTGKYELFKSTNQYNGPIGRAQQEALRKS